MVLKSNQAFDGIYVCDLLSLGRLYLPTDLYDLNFICIIRIAFSIAISDTPTSANTASHIVASPPAPRIRTMPFTANANVIFCHTIDKMEGRSILNELSLKLRPCPSSSLCWV